jgi:hypothetical protein
MAQRSISVEAGTAVPSVIGLHELAKPQPTTQLPTVVRLMLVVIEPYHLPSRSTTRRYVGCGIIDYALPAGVLPIEMMRVFETIQAEFYFYVSKLAQLMPEVPRPSTAVGAYQDEYSRLDGLDMIDYLQYLQVSSEISEITVEQHGIQLGYQLWCQSSLHQL